MFHNELNSILNIFWEQINLKSQSAFDIFKKLKIKSNVSFELSHYSMNELEFCIINNICTNF
jgi:hypothetical protein